ncbi:MAG: arginase family protein [Rhodoglobus sp.]
MTASFVVVAQWQGSGSSRAMRLVDGADAIRGDLPTASTRVVEIPLEAGDSQGSGVHRLSAVSMVRDSFAEVLAQSDSPVITVGGDCGVELAAVAHAASDEMAVIWLDAHPDLNTPETSPSGAFAGMVLRTLLGDGAAGLVPTTALTPTRVVLAGVRSIDPGEAQYIAEQSIAMVRASEVSAATLIDAVEATGATSVYVHIDLDVLDPGDIPRRLACSPTTLWPLSRPSSSVSPSSEPESRSSLRDRPRTPSTTSRRFCGSSGR